MNRELQIFKNEEFGEIRTVEVEGKPYFCGSDVARALGYAIPSKAVNTHCKGVSKMEAPTAGGMQALLFIPEGDVYRLITHSKLPSAEKKEPGIERLCLISIALGVSADYLIGADRELPDRTKPKIYKSDF